MESGFSKANSNNLPRVDAVMLGTFFASNRDFCSSEFRNVKASIETDTTISCPSKPVVSFAEQETMLHMDSGQLERDRQLMTALALRMSMGGVTTYFW
ncbi:hypothetical protein EVAR_63109_1 [Eumeta japonica]|uniref:Uncharacterized protein n=1 Tax=Eumeta variegata TaxID=151549 RepID=A0A4C1ZDW7_EUMVA|nr:hypothetical protein EVAR_63109_1 [Eumeta japonica]